MASNENPTPPATAQSGEHRASAPEWQAALATAQTIPAFARPTEKELDTLARACAEPRQLHLLLEAFGRHAATLSPDTAAGSSTSNALPSQCQLPATGESGALPYALLCDFVDASAHDLRQWINALSLFDDWLRANNHPPQPLTMLLPYLACSAEAQANSPMPLALPHILADMLELYGYDGDTAISTEP